MSDPAAVLDAALELSDSQRAALALKLMESLDGDADPNVDDAWSREISDRVEGVRSGADDTLPSSEVRRRVAMRLSKLHG